jgi:hypothetical protein
MQKLFERFDHHPGKDGWGILQSKWNYCVLKGSPLYGKCGLMAVLLGNMELMAS